MSENDDKMSLELMNEHSTFLKSCLKEIEMFPQNSV